MTNYTYYQNGQGRNSQLLASDGTNSYTWDNNGNLSAKGSTNYTWDYDDRLTGISGGAVSASYAYDYQGERIKKTVGGVETGYLYQAEDIVKETSGGVVTDYLHGIGIDDPVYLDRSGAKSYYFGDGLGSIREMTDATGTLQNSYSYGAWGELRASSATVANSYGYTGREFAEEGLYFYRARYLDPGLGRFVSEDMFRLSKGRNLYSYVTNNPILYYDPSGLWHYKFPPDPFVPPTLPINVYPPNQDIQSKLDCLQKEIGNVDFEVTEGKRYYGSDDSAHWTGDAADISGTANGMGGVWPCKVFAAAKKCGFKRVCKHRTLQHYHVDTDPNSNGGVCGDKGWPDYYDPCELCKALTNICCKLFR